MESVEGGTLKWFKHFTDAHDSKDLTKLRMKYGADGYAIYWYCLELIAGDLGGEKAITFELKHDAEVIAFNLRIDQIRVEEIMHYLVDLELFEQSADKITCLKLAKYLDKKLTRNKTIHNIIDSSESLKLASVTVRDGNGTSADNSGRSPLDRDRDREEIKDTSDSQANTNRSSDRMTKEQHEKVIGLYHELVPELPRVVISRWHGSKHAKALSARWKESETFRTAQFWNAFFETVRLNPWWMGVEQPGGAKFDGCKLAWLVKRENFDKVLERGGFE